MWSEMRIALEAVVAEMFNVTTLAGGVLLAIEVVLLGLFGSAIGVLLLARAEED